MTLHYITSHFLLRGLRVARCRGFRCGDAAHSVCARVVCIAVEALACHDAIMMPTHAGARVTSDSPALGVTPEPESMSPSAPESGSASGAAAAWCSTGGSGAAAAFGLGAADAAVVEPVATPGGPDARCCACCGCCC